MKRLLRSAALIGITIFAAACAQRPTDVGVFLKSAQGWTKLPSYDWESFMGGYEGTQGLSAESLPVARSKAAILINSVPLDPSALFWGRDPGPRGDGKWNTDLDAQPVAASSVDQGVYEVSTEGLPEGVYALVSRGGQFSFRAYFFRIAP